MIDIETVEQARAVVEQREREARELAIREEAAAIAHHRAIVLMGEQMREAQERSKQRRREGHEQARTAPAPRRIALTLSRLHEKVWSLKLDF